MTETTLDDIKTQGGPIEPQLAALAGEVDLPDAAVAWCASHIEVAAPALRSVLAEAAGGAALPDDQARLLLRGLFILGGRRDAATFPILLRFLRRPGEELELLLGDALELGLPKILSGTFDGDADALLGLAADAGCLDAVRCSAMEAAAFLTFDGRIARDRMRSWLSDFAASQPARKGDLAWVVWSNAVARLAFRELCPLVEAALADGRISKATMRKRHFEKMLAATVADPEDASRFEDASYIEDVLAALDWTRIGGSSSSGAMPSAEDARIELHLAALGKEQPFPEASLRACVERHDEAGPALHNLLDRAAAGRPLDDDESLRLFRGLFALAAARDTTACASLLRLLRRPARETDALLGEAITESLPRILISVFDGDAEGLIAVIIDRTLDDEIRGAALEAATFLTWEGRIDRERLRRLLIEFHERRPAADEAFIWFIWMESVALLDFGDLVPLVEAAWKAGRIDDSIQDWDQFKIDLARARTAWDDGDRLRTVFQVGYVDDIVAELEWTRHWGTEPGSKAAPVDAWTSPATIVNPFRDVGRNDPCPCGSGKKYKKCCLAAG